MSISLFVAKRYFFSPFKASFITLISRISMIGVGVEVMALVLILSVFNGLEDFQIGLFKTFDPDLGSSRGVRTGELIGNNLDLSNVC